MPGSFRQIIDKAVKGKHFLVVPGAHYALSARIIQKLGFETYFIGGFPAGGAGAPPSSEPPTPPAAKTGFAFVPSGTRPSAETNEPGHSEGHSTPRSSPACASETTPAWESWSAWPASATMSVCNCSTTAA